MTKKYGTGITLTAAIIFSALITFGVGLVLEKKISSSREEFNNSLRKIVLKNAVYFDENQAKMENDMEFIPGFDENKNPAGYIVYVKTPGFASNIEILMGIELNGKISGIKVLDVSKETQGLGSRIKNLAWEKLWSGRDKEYKFDKKIDAFSGATITPKSAYFGIKRALNNYANIMPQTAVNISDSASGIHKTEKDDKIISDIKTIFPDAVSYDAKMPVVNGIKYIVSYDSSDRISGYFVYLEAEGIHDFIKFNLGIGMDGKIVKLRNIDIGKNVKEYYTTELTRKWQDMWTGRDKTYKYNDKLDGVAGASISTKAMYDSIKLALDGAASLINTVSVKEKTATSEELPKTSKNKKILLKLKKVFPAAVSYGSDFRKIKGKDYITVYDSKDKIIGYFVSLEAEGVEDNLKFDLGIDTGGKISKLTNIDIGDNAQEFNDVIVTQKWQNMWAGRDKNYKYSESLDGVSGASVSTNAIFEAAHSALADFDKIKGGR